MSAAPTAFQEDNGPEAGHGLISSPTLLEKGQTQYTQHNTQYNTQYTQCQLCQAAVLNKNFLYLAIGFKLFSQLIFGDVLRQGTHKDLPRHLPTSGAVLKLDARKDQAQRERD
jgi:hypothetical protein